MTSRRYNSADGIFLVPLVIIVVEVSIDLITWMWYSLFSPLGPFSPANIPGLLLPAFIRLQLLIDLPAFVLVFAYYFIGSAGHKTRVIR
jgi:hypothetical protein